MCGLLDMGRFILLAIGLLVIMAEGLLLELETSAEAEATAAGSTGREKELEPTTGLRGIEPRP